jgi:endonuclease G
MFKFKSLPILLLLSLAACGQAQDPAEVQHLYQADEDGRYVNAGIYEVIYSEEFEQPLEVFYTVECPNGTASRKGMDFYTNDSIHTSDNKDYYDNVWDKGHMAPAADFNCDREMLFKTFSYLNCALQHERLNRGAWRFLEEYERKLALEYDVVQVHIEVHFGTKKRLLTGATIPDGFTKTIRCYGSINNGSDAEYVFFFKNEDPGERDWREFQVN